MGILSVFGILNQYKFCTISVFDIEHFSHKFISFAPFLSIPYRIVEVDSVGQITFWYYYDMAWEYFEI